MTRTYDQVCPIARTLDLIGDRWTLLVLRDLFLGASKFTEIRQHSPTLPTKILSDRLKALEQAGLLERRIYCDHPLRAEYHLTSLGRSLEPVLNAVYEWGMQHTLAPAERRAVRRRLADATKSLR